VGEQNVVGHEDHTNYLLGKKFYLNFTEEVERVFYMYLMHLPLHIGYHFIIINFNI